MNSDKEYANDRFELFVNDRIVNHETFSKYLPSMIIKVMLQYKYNLTFPQIISLIIDSIEQARKYMNSNNHKLKYKHSRRNSHKHNNNNSNNNYCNYNPKNDNLLREEKMNEILNILFKNSKLRNSVSTAVNNETKTKTDKNALKQENQYSVFLKKNDIEHKTENQLIEENYNKNQMAANVNKITDFIPIFVMYL